MRRDAGRRVETATGYRAVWFSGRTAPVIERHNPIFKSALKHQPEIPGGASRFKNPIQWVEDSREWQECLDEIWAEKKDGIIAGYIPETSTCGDPVIYTEWGYSYMYERDLCGNLTPIVMGITAKVEPDRR